MNQPEFWLHDVDSKNVKDGLRIFSADHGQRALSQSDIMVLKPVIS